MNIFRRLPLYRLLLLCGVIVLAGVSVTALALALGSGPTPPAKALPVAVHDALTGAHSQSFEGVSADVTLTNHLLEGAELAGGGEGGGIASNPLISGASGRLWIAKDGHVRLELQSNQGDTQILYDGHTIELYDAATNTLYRYTPPARAAASDSRAGAKSTEHEIDALRKRLAARGIHNAHIFAGATEATGQIAGTPLQHSEVPSIAEIEEAIAKLSKHAVVSGATPVDVAGRAAYTVRVSPKEGGSQLGGAELSFDAANGLPLRTAIYSANSSAPVIELAATSISYGPVASSVFAFAPPANAKIEELHLPAGGSDGAHTHGHGKDKLKLITHGHGPSTIAVLEAKTNGKASGDSTSGLPRVQINGVTATELRTELGTLLSFERGGVSYLIAGSVTSAQIEALARGL